MNTICLNKIFFFISIVFFDIHINSLGLPNCILIINFTILFKQIAFYYYLKIILPTIIDSQILYYLLYTPCIYIKIKIFEKDITA